MHCELVFLLKLSKKIYISNVPAYFVGHNQSKTAVVREIIKLLSISQ